MDIKKRWRGLVIPLIITFVIIFLLNSARIFDKRTLPFVVPDHQVQRQILTYFYYWYDLPKGTHSSSLTDFPSDSNTSYRNIDWFKKQLTDMEEAGIDTALVVYWSHFEPGYKIGLENLLVAREQLLVEGKKPPKIGMFYDTGLLDRVKNKNFISRSGREVFYSPIKEFYDVISTEHRGLISGRPIVWLWASWFPFSYNQATFDHIYEQFQTDFGVKPYIVREASWNFAKKQGWFGEKIDYSKPITTDDVYSWGAALDGFRDSGGNIAAIGPGYDERGLTSPDRSGRFKLRQNGEWYLNNFQKALDSGKPILVIETWNEFHEASDIAETRGYQRKYIDLTTSFSKLWYQK